jgi:uncharacterized protein (DUF849 family)
LTEQAVHALFDEL